MSVLSSIFFRADSVQGKLDAGIVVKLVSPAGDLLKVFGLQLLQVQHLGPLKVGEACCCVLWLRTPFSTAILAFGASALALGGAGASFLALDTILVKSDLTYIC